MVDTVVNTVVNTAVSAKVWAVVPAAGIGRRFGGDIPKQYLPLAGEPVLARTLGALRQAQLFSGICVAVAENDQWFYKLIPTWPTLWTCIGGEERAASVLAGLESLLSRGACEADWVMVHDAARPNISTALILAVFAEAQQSGAAIAALPASDTIKQTASAGSARIQNTLDRRQLWLAQTPQCFPLGALYQALQCADLDRVTDEASAMEDLMPVALVPGQRSNIKITETEDLTLCEALWQR